GEFAVTSTGRTRRACELSAPLGIGVRSSSGPLVAGRLASGGSDRASPPRLDPAQEVSTTMTTPTTLYVSRIVDVPADELWLALDHLPRAVVGAGVSLQLGAGRPPRPPTSAVDPWRSTPALLRRRRRPAFRVSVEVTAWSDDRSQLGIRPEGRRCSWWVASFC